MATQPITENKSFYARTEVWLTTLASVAAILLPGFPTAAFANVGTYALSRGMAKRAGDVVRAGWKTTEFWASLLGPAIKVLWPDFPNEALYALGAYTVGMGVKKMATAAPLAAAPAEGDRLGDSSG